MLFALERYESSGEPTAPTPLCIDHAGARVVATVHLTADDVLLALVEGVDAETVTSAAHAAGWRVDRISPANWITCEDHREGI